MSGFSPLAVKETVHHMMLVGCSAPVSLPPARDNLWNCGGSLGKHTLSPYSHPLFELRIIFYQAKYMTYFQLKVPSNFLLASG